MRNSYKESKASLAIPFKLGYSATLSCREKNMKKEIHPNYQEVKVTCSCGNTFSIGSILERDFHLEICSECHPFYTGQQKIIDTAGRVERFRKKYAKREVANTEKAKK